MPDAPDSKPPSPDPKPDAPSDKGDMIAIGIGCLVVLIFLFAVVMVGISRE